MTDETWKPVVGWEGIYEISSHGRVRSFDRVVRCGYDRTRVFPGRILGGWTHNGYPMVELQDKAGGRRRRVFAHRLVCEAFHGPAPSPAHEVAHGDGNPANAHFRNLRWATHLENEADKAAHGTKPIGEAHGGAKLKAEQVIEIRASKETRKEMAVRFGVTKSTIDHIRDGKAWRHLEPA